MATRKKDGRVNVSGVVRTRRTKPLATNSPPSFDPMRFVEASPPAKSREALIAELAYFRALNRSFEPGHEVEDWLAAEAEIEKRQGA
jgi:hypothetical protein